MTKYGVFYDIIIVMTKYGVFYDIIMQTCLAQGTRTV